VIRRSLLPASLGAALIVLSAPGLVLAHGLHADPNRSLIDLPLGIEHMMLGWDHLLFIVGVVLLGRTLRNAVKLISLAGEGAPAPSPSSPSQSSPLPSARSRCR